MDASKIGVKADIEAWWPHLASGGVIAGAGFRYNVGNVTWAVAEAFHTDVFLDADALWWTIKQKETANRAAFHTDLALDADALWGKIKQTEQVGQVTRKMQERVLTVKRDGKIT